MRSIASTYAAFAPPPEVTICEWAEANRILPKGTTNRPGPFRAEKFQRQIMDAVVDPNVRRVSVQKSTQVGYTDAVLLNIIGYYIDADPKPMMLVFPRDTDAKDKSKKIVAPMIQNSPALRDKVRDVVSRRGGNTQQLKQFDGGFLKITGANSGAGLRSDPCAVVLFDEADAYPDDVDGEGDPIKIGERRTDGFDDEKIVIGSTPAMPKGSSRIEAEVERGSLEYFHMPCPFCGEMQPLLWRDPERKTPDGKPIYNFRWEKDAEGMPIPETVKYYCRKCETGIPERYKQQMLDRGEYIPTYPERREHRSFRIWAAYSPWKPIWHLLAKEWVESQDNPEEMKAFVNLRLGETWDEGAEGLTSADLSKRVEAYPKNSSGEYVLPWNVACLVSTVDVQHNRLEVQTTGFGPGEEQFLIDHTVFWGPPGLQPGQKENEDLCNVWTDLEDHLLREWEHKSGAKLRSSITLVDSGAYSDAVYDFVMPRQHNRRRVFACKGVDHLSRPGLVQESTTKKSKVRLFLVGTYVGKDRVFARMRIMKHGAGFLHFPDWTTDEYFNQLTAESKVPKKNRFTKRTQWVYVNNQERNEALDLTVYAHAGLYLLQHVIDPVTFRDLSSLAAEVQKGLAPLTLTQPGGRRVRSRGI